MDKKFRFLTILILAGLILSACGSATTPAPTVAAPVATTAPATAAPVAPATAAPAAPATAAPATAAPTVAPPATVPPVLAAGAVKVSDKDGMTMIYIPAGAFSMGSAGAGSTADEQPVHTVTLDAYWIDKTEVSNAMFTKCVQAGSCQQPVAHSNTHTNYFTAAKYANFPVIALSWEHAAAYCTWVGRSLPTEAQWEKAAVGTDGRTYPWGNNIPNSTLLNFNNPAGDPVAVGSYKLGASPFGLMDMAGNLREWVSDWYGASYYSVSPSTNPTGPAAGQYKVLRGGSWFSSPYLVRSADRGYLPPDQRDVTVGFRCAVPAQ